MADVETIGAFNAALASETEERRLDGRIVRAGVEALLQDHQKGWYAVAVCSPNTDQQKIVGQILVTFEWSDWRNGHFWWLQSLYVDRSYRQRGVFRQLYEYVHKQAREHTEKVCGFRLYVERNNHSAQQTYAHLGFLETPYQIHEIEFSDDHVPPVSSTS